jgi:hypothetical protein
MQVQREVGRHSGRPIFATFAMFAMFAMFAIFAGA